MRVFSPSLRQIRSTLPAMIATSIVTMAQADPVTYTVDPARSQLNITSGTIVVFGAFTAPAQPLDANGFSAALSGHVDGDLTAASLSFANTTRIIPVEHGNYLPGPLGSASTPAPGSYAILYPTQPALGFDFSSITRHLEFSWSDAVPHALVGSGPQTFPAAGTLWTVVAGVADLSAGNPPQSDLTTVPPATNTVLADGSLSIDSGVETLTVPVAYQMRILAGIIVVTQNFEGTVVATRTLGTADGACCDGSTCHIAAATACAGTNQSFTGPGTACNVPSNVTTPCCLADFNQSGAVSVQDIFDFLAAYFGSAPNANINGGDISVQDIFDFLAAYFGGCN